MPKQILSEQEWSHFFDVDDLSKGRVSELTIEASEEECADLSRRLGVESIQQASADLKVKMEGGVVHVWGRFDCTVTQNCVITMEPFENKLSEDVEGWFADKESRVSFAAAKKEREVTKSNTEVEIVDEKDDPEDIIEGRIDLGELVAQHISLAIPLYPQKEGAVYENGDDNVSIDDKSPLRKNPFEALKDWKEER